jgi:hypothetical protein
MARSGKPHTSAHAATPAPDDAERSPLTQVRTPGKVRRAIALEVAIPLIVLALSYIFIDAVAQPTCLHIYGRPGACDPLHAAAQIAVNGQLAVIATVSVLIALSQRHGAPQPAAAPYYLAVAVSIGWALLTCLFAAQRMVAGP